MWMKLLMNAKKVLCPPVSLREKQMWNKKFIDTLKTKQKEKLTRRKLNSPPDTHRHDSMMNDMQSCYMRIFLSQNKEDCVSKLYKLRNIIPIGSCCHSPCIIRVAVVNGLTAIVILPEPSVLTKFNEDPCWYKDHYQVVRNHKPSNVKGFPVLHELGSDDFDSQDIRETEKKGRQRASNQRPGLNSWV